MPTFIFLYSKQILLSDANIGANYIHMLADETIHTGNTMVQAFQVSCKGNLKAQIHNPILSSYKKHNDTNSSFDVNVVIGSILQRTIADIPAQEDFFAFAGRLSSDYTLISMAMTKIHLDGNSKVIGSRVGVFGNRVDVDYGAAVMSNAMGCKGGTGFSSGLKDDQFASFCGGSGGSHGGIGGIGLSSEPSRASSCQKMKTYPYGDPANPILEGSGGSNAKTCLGGNGGGVVTIGAYNLIYKWQCEFKWSRRNP